MNRPLRTWVVPLIATLSFAGVLAWQHRATTELRHQLEREQKSLGDRASLRTGDGASIAASEVPPRGESAINAEDEAAIARLRKEIAELKARAAARSRKDPASVTASAPALSMTKQMLPVEQWKHAGHATPTAALETVLWAASVGDVDVLAGSFSIDPVVRTKVNGLLFRLPETIRKDYDTPERLMALLTAGDVPLGAAQIHDYHALNLGGTALVAVLRDTENRHRAANVTLRQEGEAWKLVVPGEAVDKYAAILKGNAVSAER
jgi:hypothetical protein